MYGIDTFTRYPKHRHLTHGAKKSNTHFTGTYEFMK